MARTRRALHDSNRDNSRSRPLWFMRGQRVAAITRRSAWAAAVMSTHSRLANFSKISASACRYGVDVANTGAGGRTVTTKGRSGDVVVRVLRPMVRESAVE